MASEADVLIRDEGTLVLFAAGTDAGREWLEENIGHAERFGPRYVVEHRYAPDIIVGARSEGLEVTPE